MYRSALSSLGGVMIRIPRGGTRRPTIKYEEGEAGGRLVKQRRLLIGAQGLAATTIAPWFVNALKISKGHQATRTVSQRGLAIHDSPWASWAVASGRWLAVMKQKPMGIGRSSEESSIRLHMACNTKLFSFSSGKAARKTIRTTVMFSTRGYRSQGSAGKTLQAFKAMSGSEGPRVLLSWAGLQSGFG